MNFSRSVSDIRAKESVNPPVVDQVGEELLKPPQIFIDTIVESRDPANTESSAVSHILNTVFYSLNPPGVDFTMLYLLQNVIRPN